MAANIDNLPALLPAKSENVSWLDSAMGMIEHIVAKAEAESAQRLHRSHMPEQPQGVITDETA
jgi:hypothetical protein